MGGEGEREGEIERERETQASLLRSNEHVIKRTTT